MAKSEDYLEVVFKDAFKRELEVDENVARTLPFFAATLALAATLYSFIIAGMPGFAITFLSLSLHLLLLGAVVLLGWILWFLFQAVRQREYRIPPKETELLEWAASLRAHFEGEGLKPVTVDARVLEQLRDKMILEYAASAEHNRAANRPKLEARAKGFTALVALLGVAFFMIGIMFVAERASPKPEGSEHAEAGGIQRPHGFRGEEDAAGAAAAGAEVSGGARGREVPVGSRRQYGEQVSGNDKTPPQNPPPAPQPMPQAPTHQILKKDDGGGGPLTERR